MANLPKTRRSRERPTVHYCWTEMLYSNHRKCQYLCSQHIQACSSDCHTELHSEQRSRKHRRLNFMPIAFGHRSSFFCSVGMKFSLLRFLYLCSEGSSDDNQKSKPVSVGCTNIGIFWYCCTAFQSNSSERLAFLLTSGVLVNQPILTASLGRAKGGGGPRTLRCSHSPCFLVVNLEGRKNSFPVEFFMNCLLVT